MLPDSQRRLTVLHVPTGDEELAEGATVALGAGVGEADLGRLTGRMLGGR